MNMGIFFNNKKFITMVAFVFEVFSLEPIKVGAQREGSQL